MSANQRLIYDCLICLNCLRSRRFRVIPLVTALALTVSASTLRPPEYYAESQVYVGPNNGCPIPIGGTPCVLAASAGNGAPLAGSTADQGGTLTYTAMSTANYGTLKAGESGAFSGAPSPAFAGVFAISYFVDIMDIESPALDGQTGYLGFNYELDGAISQSGSFGSLGAVAVAVNNAEVYAVYNTSTSGLHSFLPLQFTYGVPFNVEFDLGAVSGTISPTMLGAFYVPPGPQFVESSRYSSTPGSANADFSDTFYVSSAQVFDSSMNPVSGVTVTSAAGIFYNVAGAVPEPGTWLGLIAPLSFIFIAARRRGA